MSSVLVLLREGGRVDLPGVDEAAVGPAVELPVLGASAGLQGGEALVAPHVGQGRRVGLGAGQGERGREVDVLRAVGIGALEGVAGGIDRQLLLERGHLLESLRLVVPLDQSVLVDLHGGADLDVAGEHPLAAGGIAQDRHAADPGRARAGHLRRRPGEAGLLVDEVVQVDPAPGIEPAVGRQG